MPKLYSRCTTSFGHNTDVRAFFSHVLSSAEHQAGRFLPGVGILSKHASSLNSFFQGESLQLDAGFGQQDIPYKDRFVDANADSRFLLTHFNDREIQNSRIKMHITVRPFVLPSPLSPVFLSISPPHPPSFLHLFFHPPSFLPPSILPSLALALLFLSFFPTWSLLPSSSNSAPWAPFLYAWFFPSSLLPSFFLWHSFLCFSSLPHSLSYFSLLPFVLPSLFPPSPLFPFLSLLLFCHLGHTLYFSYPSPPHSFPLHFTPIISLYYIFSAHISRTHRESTKRVFRRPISRVQSEKTLPHPTRSRPKTSYSRGKLYTWCGDRWSEAAAEVTRRPNLRLVTSLSYRTDNRAAVEVCVRFVSSGRASFWGDAYTLNGSGWEICVKRLRKCVPTRRNRETNDAFQKHFYYRVHQTIQQNKTFTNDAHFSFHSSCDCDEFVHNADGCLRYQSLAQCQ